MRTASRDRIAKVVLSTVLAGGLTVSGLACGGSQSPPPSQQADLQQQPAPPPRVLLPSNAPIAAAPPPTSAPPTVSAQPTGPVATPGGAPPRPDASPSSAGNPRVTTPPPTTPPQPALNIPVGAEWTIYCYAVKGPSHVEDAANVKAGLIRKTGLPDWYVIHGRDESNIYFGFYQSVLASERKNPAEVARAETAMKMVKELKDLAGNQPFSKAVFVSLEAPDPSASADWNLANVDRGLAPKDPKRAYWSLQVAAFRADPKRKEAAVDMVKTLRAQGVDAYYYHGDSVSSVCVGRWPTTALKAQNRYDDIKDQAVNANTGNLTVSAVPLDDLEKIDGLKIYKANAIDGKDTVTVAPKLEVLDPTMAAAMRKFPHHEENYVEGRRMPNGSLVYNPSFLVVIPRPTGNGLYDSDDADESPAARRRERTPTGTPAGGMVAPRERVLGADAGRGFRPGQ
jgi:hypothetical protein